ncbi:MAG: PDZ domain-containing protein [Gammaproteobacteria bacterium]|nr:PDZ domain-containing protein [Gammaproteobacteria bacterium]
MSNMDAKTLLICVSVSTLFGAASAAIVSQVLNAPEIAISGSQNSLQRRVATLEASLASETAARTALQGQLQQLASTQKPSTSTDPAADPPDDSILAIQAGPDVSLSRADVRAQRMARLQPDYQRQQLIEAGFSEQDAAFIVRTESDLALQQLRSDHMNRREYFQQLDQEGTDWFAKHNPLRAKLGDEKYERYLESKGHPTSVEIGRIMAGSPGELAGLQPGDVIRNYDGQRVFNGSDLNDLTAQGTLGQNVIVEIEREGETEHISIPRGPIGISSGGRRRFGR